MRQTSTKFEIPQTRIFPSLLFMADAALSAILQTLATVVTQNASNEFRLVEGVDEDVTNIRGTLHMIRASLADAERRQVTQQAVKLWLEKLKSIAYEIDETVDDWSAAILKIQISQMGESQNPRQLRSCLRFRSPCFYVNRVVVRRDIALRIKDLRLKLDLISVDKDRYNLRSVDHSNEMERPRSASFVDVSGVYGRDEDKKFIVSKLLPGENEHVEDMGLNIVVVSIVGMGGIGKTTLAQLVYGDDRVKEVFKKRIWVCVSDPFDEVRVGKAILRGIGSDVSGLEWEAIPTRINETMKEQKFLLVLDDMWTEDFSKWDVLSQALKSAAKGSRILVTTRKMGVANMIGSRHTHSLGELPVADCYTLFTQTAFCGKSKECQEKFDKISMRLAEKCQGLPLTAKILGSMMRFKDDLREWRGIIEKSELWELEVAQSGILPVLLLSYYDLPSPLKRCFLYCALFPKDSEIERDKLIKLWSAEGYLYSDENEEIEVVGQKYFESLVMRSFLQSVVKDEDNNSILICKMHDIVHGFATFLTKSECFIMTSGAGLEGSKELTLLECRHLTIVREAGKPFPTSVCEAKKLRTLLSPDVASDIAHVLPKIFQSLTCLRSIDLSYNSLKELPDEVGNLTHLRYLDLSSNKFIKLPKALCDLCYLESLNLNYCWLLQELPIGFEKLINLRHLEIKDTGRLRYFPKGVGKLTSLRTLSHFIIGGNQDQEVCCLRDLNNLNNLRGTLRIIKLENATDLHQAENANLMSKKHLHGLILDFYTPETTGPVADNIIEALQPHPNLEFLEIQRLKGIEFPRWILSLINLRRLHLSLSKNCVRLPSLGNLPCLEILAIRDMNNLAKVGCEFVGLSDSPVGKSTKFQKLKELTFYRMKAWEEWDANMVKRAQEEISIMPCLLTLQIKHCPKLKMLPYYIQATPLHTLQIIGCPAIQQRCDAPAGEDWSKISHVPNIHIED